MSLVDELRSRRNSPQAVWTRFTMDYQRGTLDLYLFCEGRGDLSFYQPYLRARWGSRGKVYAYDCQGKDHVVELIPRVQPTLDSKWRAVFFIDKDVDDFCSYPRHRDQYLFETDYYAIENYIACQTAITVYWTDLAHLPATDSRLTHALEAYAQASESFFLAMRTVMGWIIHLRREGRRVVLNDVSIENLVELDSECHCSLKLGWAEHILAASNTHGVTYNTSSTAAVGTELETVDPKVYTRGKYDLWFFVRFLNLVMLTVTERVPSEPRRVPSVQLSYANAIDILGPRLQPPPTLVAFLDRVLPT